MFRRRSGRRRSNCNGKGPNLRSRDGETFAQTEITVAGGGGDDRGERGTIRTCTTGGPMDGRADGAGGGVRGGIEAGKGSVSDSDLCGRANAVRGRTHSGRGVLRT